VLSGNYVSRIPAANVEFGELSALQASCVALKRWLTALDPIESTFSPIPVGGASLTKAYRSLSRRRDAVAATLHRFEALSERKVFAAYGIQDDDLAAVLEDTGTPAGWGNVVEGYDAPPPLPEGIQDTVRLSDQSLETSRTLPEAELVRLKHRLRVLFEAGPGEAAEAAESPSEGDDEDEDATVASAAQVSMPPETFLEELSQKLGTHPTSIFWLLEDLLKDEGVVCRPLLQRTVEDYVSVLVLRLLGHQWPTALANREVPPAWADDDGIIPITAGTGEPALAARVRERFAEDFGVDNARAVELEFGRIIGKDLDEWLASTFFARHIVKFKKRPVAWQLESRPMRSTERQRQNSSRTRPAFACLVYFHRLDADSLPKVRTQYVGALRTSFQTELERLDKQGQRTGEQDARRVELELKLEELREFDDRVAEVVASGFGSDAVHALLSGESLDKWGARIAGGKAPSTPDSFRAQETRYEPHIDDGVRANIAPLQRAVLLATEVLGAKDVEAAIVDRAKWRMEERRLCREGKLTEPRWWTPMTGKGAA
jgi:hypothetical protein